MDSSSLLIGMSAAPIVAALLTVVRPLVPGKRWMPLAAVALGILWNIGSAYAAGQPNIGLAVMLGVLAGLGASGLYSGGKALAGK